MFSESEPSSEPKDSLSTYTVLNNATNKVKCQKENNGDYLELQELNPDVEINRLSHYDDKTRVLEVSICADSMSIHENPTCTVISTKLSECAYSKNYLPGLKKKFNVKLIRINHFLNRAARTVIS